MLLLVLVDVVVVSVATVIYERTLLHLWANHPLELSGKADDLCWLQIDSW